CYRRHRARLRRGRTAARLVKSSDVGKGGEIVTNREGVLSDAEAGYGQGLVPGPRPALIMIDFARAYFEPGAGFYMGRDDCLASAERLLESARVAGVHVVHTKVAYAEGGIDGGYFFKKFAPLSAFVGESELGETMPQVMPLPHELVITKQYASAFFGTSLSSY